MQITCTKRKHGSELSTSERCVFSQGSFSLMRCESAGGGSCGRGVKCPINVQVNKTSFRGQLRLRYIQL